MICTNGTELDRLCKDFFTARAILVTSLFPINVIGSALVLKAIHRAREVHNISTFQFIANLAVSDLLVSVFSLPILVTLRYYEELSMSAFHDLKTVYYFIYTTKRIVGALTLIAISLDKVLACLFHLKYNNYLTTSRVCAIIGLIWAFSVSISLLHWAENNKHWEKYCCQPYRVYLDTSLCFLMLLCFFIILASNLYLMFLSREHRKQDRVQRRETSTNNRKIYENYKSIRSLGLLLSMYGIGLLPLVCYTLIKELIGCSSIKCVRATEYLTIIHYIDLNTRFVIYCCRFKSLRNSLFNVIGCGRLGRNRVRPQGMSGKPKENGVANVTLVDEAHDGKISTIDKS